MKEEERITRDVDRIMADLDNIPIESPSPFLAERIASKLESEGKLATFRLLSGWLRPVLIGAMVVFNIVLSYLALTQSAKALDQRIEALDRMAAEYVMSSSDDPFSNPETRKEQ